VQRESKRKWKMKKKKNEYKQTSEHLNLLFFCFFISELEGEKKIFKTNKKQRTPKKKKYK